MVFAGRPGVGRWEVDQTPLAPASLRSWYGLRSAQNGAGQAIVITEFARAPSLRADVNHFSAHYGLPRTCGSSHARQCFRLAIEQLGPRKAPRTAPDAEPELDVEWAHAIAPRATIIVVASEHVIPLLDEIARFARAGRAHVFSNSWCTPCTSGHQALADRVFARIAFGCGVAHAVCLWVSGDRGNPGAPPSNSPYALSVGGTRFQINADDSTRREGAWPRSGFGETDVPLRRPVWQRRVRCGGEGGLSCSYRAIPDVSATAYGAPTFAPRKQGGSGWSVFGGTSLSTPLWAALVAVANQQLQAHHQPPIGIDELHHVLYGGEVAAGLDDIPPAGWDWATGIGSPKAGIVDVLAHAIERYRALHPGQ